MTMTRPVRLGLSLLAAISIGLGGAGQLASAQAPPPTCPTERTPKPIGFLKAYGCSTGCSPYPDGCCAYETYDDGTGTLTTWRQCNVLFVCSNPLGTPNGYKCNTP